MTQVTDSLKQNMPAIVNGLLDVIEGDGGTTRLWKYRHSIEILGKLMCTIGKFSSAIADMKSLGGTYGSPAKIKKTLKTVGDLFIDGGGAREAINNILKAVVFLGPILKQAGGINTKAMIKVSEFIDNVNKVVPTIQGMKWNQSFYDTARVLIAGLPGAKNTGTGPIKMIQIMIERITGEGGFQANASNIHVKTITKLVEFLEKGVKPAIEAINDIPETLTNRATAVASAVGDLQTISQAITKKEIRAAVQIGEALAGSGKVSLDLTKDLTMNVHVQVNMSAEQLAKGIVKTDTMKSSMGQGG